jgi:hypothetical protein
MNTPPRPDIWTEPPPAASWSSLSPAARALWVFGIAGVGFFALLIWIGVVLS